MPVDFIQAFIAAKYIMEVFQKKALLANSLSNPFSYGRFIAEYILDVFVEKTNMLSQRNQLEI